MFNSKRLLIIIVVIVIVTLLMIGIGIVGYFYTKPAELKIFSDQKKIVQIAPFSSKFEYLEYLSQASPYLNYNLVNELFLSPEAITTKENSDFFATQENLENKLIIADQIFIIVKGNKIKGYNFDSQNNLRELWSISLNEKSAYYSAFYQNNNLYLITKTNIDQFNACPIAVYSHNQMQEEIACSEIYHSLAIIPADALFNIMILNPENGNLVQKKSLVGSYNNSLIYSSSNDLYHTYTYPGDEFKLMTDFFSEDGKDLISDEILNKLYMLKEFNISPASKENEFSTILNNYFNSLSVDEESKIKNEIKNKLNIYWQNKKREYIKTAIVKLNINDLEIKNTEEVSGQPLGQNSLSEFQNNFRIVVKINRNISDQNIEDNDFNVLDDNLKSIKAINDFNENKKVLSARFVANQLYYLSAEKRNILRSVNLEQITSKPKTTELIFSDISTSSYPLTENLVLSLDGVDNQTKITLFNRDTNDIFQEKSQYLLAETKQDILNNQTVFLNDSEKKIFFIASVNNGYIFSYQNNNLELKTVIPLDSLIINSTENNNLLYLASLNDIKAIDLNNWLLVNKINLPN